MIKRMSNDIDNNSVGGALLTICLGVFGTVSSNDLMLYAGFLAGISTTIYNIFKIIQLKKKG